jgi:crotonobetainyl-CoA:carnitine CoA-transferase CaiB-like acyl-CoA transferase
MRLLVALIGLAIGFAIPVLAQEKDTVDLQTRQEIEAVDAKLDEAINKNDAAAVAALFTEDAILLEPVDQAPERSGMFSGRQAIEKQFAQKFTEYHLADTKGKLDQINSVDAGLKFSPDWGPLWRSQEPCRFWHRRRLP